jgi:hypothetical protein
MRRDVYSSIVLILVFSFVLTSKTSMAAQEWAPFQVSLYSPVQLVDENKDIVGLRLSLLYGKNANVSGIDLGLGVADNDNFNGIQILGVGSNGASHPLRAVKGIQIAGVFNPGVSHLSGIQIAGLGNGAVDGEGIQVSIILNMVGDRQNTGHFNGVQISAFNVVYGEYNGIQIGGFNFGDVNGVQIGGLNAGVDNGLQIGAINKGRNSVQIGVINGTGPDFNGVQIGLYNSIVKDQLITLNRSKGSVMAKALQIVLFNDMDDITGVQIGLYNSCGDLKGVQIGLVNHIEQGLFPYLPIINAKF